VAERKYKSVAYEKSAPGFALLLDGRIALTPLGNHYYIKSEALVKVISAEWSAQEKHIRRETMPLTQIASVAVDFAAVRREELCADLLSYSDTDLVCYRAGDVPALRRAQEGLDSMITWAEGRFGISLVVTDGVMPVRQPPQNKEKLAQALFTYDDWRLAAIAVAAKPLSSLILALAFIEGVLDADAAFRLAHLEEIFETEKWGRDEEKESRMDKLKEDVAAVAEYLALL